MCFRQYCRPFPSPSFDVDTAIVRFHVLQMFKRWGIGETSLFTQYECVHATSKANFPMAIAFYTEIIHFVCAPRMFDVRTFLRLFSNKHECYDQKRFVDYVSYG